jgi:hypothetical protein
VTIAPSKWVDHQRPSVFHHGVLVGPHSVRHEGQLGSVAQLRRPARASRNSSIFLKQPFFHRSDNPVDDAHRMTWSVCWNGKMFDAALSKETTGENVVATFAHAHVDREGVARKQDPLSRA